MARPYVFIFSTATVDGKIASHTGFSRLSCVEDFILQHELRSRVDAVMVGSNTVLADNPRLTVRLARGRSPLRVVVDSRLRVSPGAKVFSGGRGVLVTTEDHGDEELEAYRRAGAVIVRAGRGRVDLALALEALYKLGVRRLMVEGGGGLNCALLSRGLVDEVLVTVAPYLFGSGVSLVDCRQPVFDGERVRVELSLVEYRLVCGSWVHLRYAVVNNHRLLDGRHGS